MLNPMKLVMAAVMSDLEVGLDILAIFVAPLGVALLAVGWLEKRLRKANPSARPFMWGYWTAITGIAVPIVVGLGFRAGNATFSQFVLACVVYLPVNICLLCRHRWALIAATILSLNPIIWIANFFYTRNRWNELKVVGVIAEGKRFDSDFR